MNADAAPAPSYQQDSEPARITVPKSEVRKRSQLVGVRMTPDEYAEAQALAAAHGLTVPDLLRKCLLAVQLDEAKREAPWTQHLNVVFSDACTDVLVWLAGLDEHQWRHIEQIAEAAAPDDASEPQRSASYALYTLHEAGLVTYQKIDGSVTWQVTDEGRAAVRDAQQQAGES